MEASSDVRGYQDLRIQVESPAPGRYHAEMRSPAGECKLDFSLPYGQDRIDLVVGTIWNASERPSRRGAGGALDPYAELGRMLYTCIFTGQGEALLRRSYDLAAGSGFGLRLLVSMCDEAAQLLPWELIYDGRDYLALSARSPLVRSVPRGQNPLPSPAGGLRVLAAVADLPFSNGRWKEMTSTLYASLQKQFRQLTVKLIVDVTPAQFERELATGAHDIVHLCGHADRPTLNTRAFYLRDDKGEPVPLLPRRLAEALQRSGDVKLVCLDACNSDVLAADLADFTGFPAVYGVQSTISDQGADTFVRSFLTALLSGHTLTMAVTQGRQAIDREKPGSREWALPVLYTSSPDGQLALSLWQSNYNTGEAGTAKGIVTEPAEPARSAPGKASRERQKLETWLAIKRKNLEALEQQLTSSKYPSPEMQKQQADLRAEIASLEAQLDEGA